MTLAEKILKLKSENNKSYWAERITSELEYLTRLSGVQGGRFDRDIELSADALLESVRSDGVITDAAAQFAEKVLLPYSAECKKYKVICVGHAHIDMNWMWGFQETAGLTVDTFRTVLGLMKEYPEFTFAQSQASVYRIVEKYAPWLMEEIKLRIKEGRWEVTASTWVETDKNMPSGESLTRHILNTKRYMSDVWGMDPESLNIDFEPDTFGHSANVPEICASGGVKYYYHCRGFSDECLYRWRSESGAELLCCKEAKWYNGSISPEAVLMAPEFCSRYGTDTMLKVYGVGDHGGGPTRRDIERIRDISSWPLVAEMRCGTFGEYFAAVEKIREKLPVYSGEKNFIFTGCYTSQSRIKMANRIAEARLGDGEALAAVADMISGEKCGSALSGAWEKVLFNHFHDILPGSGKVETREFALGEFQKALAAVNAASTRAMACAGDHIDVSLLDAESGELTVSEGAGVGFSLGQDSGFSLPKTERGRGKNRAFIVYNTTEYLRTEPVEITVWDWPGDVECLKVLRFDGAECAHQILEIGNWYWDHRFVRLTAELAVPPLGWTVCWITEGEKKLESFEKGWFERNDRVEDISDEDIVLDNGLICARFDRCSMKLVSLRPRGGVELIDEPSCRFEFIEEDTVSGMSAWRVGNRSRVEDLNETRAVRVEKVERGPVRSSVRYSLFFGASKLTVTVSLGAKSRLLEFAVKADWHEIGSKERIPSLVFSVPFGYVSGKSFCDIPMGVIKREPARHDIPCLSFCAPENAMDPGLPLIMLTSDTKYGFRSSGKEVSVSLIRASTDPDPYPEYGVHDMRLGVAVSEQRAEALLETSVKFSHPTVYASVTPHVGSLPADASAVRVSGAALSALKPAEDGNGIVVRVYNVSGEKTVARVELFRRPGRAVLVDCCENQLRELEIDGNGASVELPSMGVAAIKFIS